MSVSESSPTGKIILAIDDEAVSRALLEYFLNKAGYHTIALDSAEAARHYVAHHGPAAVHCVVTDYRMPGETGLELLLWLKQQDRALAVIMITATTEREFVAETLRGGATDFLDKPIAEAALLKSVERAIRHTEQDRERADAERTINQVGKTQHQLFGLGAEAAKRIDVCFSPKHQAGGDFINYFQLTPDTFLVLTADVSGHDLHAAFISAYFQGLVRGMLESGQATETVLTKFNHFLLEEWGIRHSESETGTQASVCVCTALVKLGAPAVTISNHGLPQPWHVSADGRINRCDTVNGPPLGWFHDLPIHPHRQNCQASGQLFLWTDGLEDLAEALRVNPLSLATALQQARALGQTVPQIALAKDDVLVVSIQLAADPTTAPHWHPVLHESYQGTKTPPIDDWQQLWERNLALAVPDLPESRRFDVLLALRESLINALIHGCAGRPELQGQLTITVNPAQRTLRTIISDPGPGHDFSRKPHEAADELADLHRGLNLITRLATQLISNRNGAELILDFRY
jgi:FixJ family two-component response regulator/anti-sigma regulatory factor (Ser/Thr protein kinase)